MRSPKKVGARWLKSACCTRMEKTKFDMTYYLNCPRPMVGVLLGLVLKGASAEQGISVEEPGSPAPYVTIAHLVFDSVQMCQPSFGLPPRETMESTPKYTNSEPIVQI